MDWLLDPHVERHLLRDDGEVIVDEVKHHWFAFFRASCEAAAGLALLVSSLFVPIVAAWLLLSGALVSILHASWLTIRESRDRFVVTNMRVFRVHGVLSKKMATMPLSRVLDISVARPLHGRILGFGHFCFESAAQEQGLREILYVGRPLERDLAIQRVLQGSGLRGPRIPN